MLKELRAAQLAALNHGTFRAPIPGRETQMVLTRCRNWAAAGVGEIKIGDHPSNPTIMIQLTGVDTETILANAQAVDNPGNRRRKIRELLFEALGIADRDEMYLAHEIPWRGTERSFQVLFGNVRELTTESLTAKGGQRKAILDFPFDEPGHTPADDIARLGSFRETEPPSRTLVWLPAFLSRESQKDLGTLVKLADILKNDDTFHGYAAHLSAIDQVQARELLRNQRIQLRRRVVRYLEGAYGVDRPIPGSVDETHRPENHFQSLDPSFTPEPPVGVNLRQAFEHLLDQMLPSQYPAHPKFEVELKPAALRKVHAEVARAVQSPDGRIIVEKPARPLMRQIAVPLKLGEMGEEPFVLWEHWYDHFNRRVSGEITVGKLRAAIDEPSPMGLPVRVQNLLILYYADKANRSFVLHGGPAHPKLDDLRDELELRERTLPSPETWDEAVLRAGKIFGLGVSPLRNASNSSELADKLAALAAPKLEPCQRVLDRLADLYADFAIAGGARLDTAGAVVALVRGLVEAGDEHRIEALASAAVATSFEAMGTSFKKAEDVGEALDRTRWELFQAIVELTGEREVAARSLRAQLVEALTFDEYALALGSRLARLEGAAIRLLAPPPVVPETPGIEVVEEESHRELGAEAAGALLDELRGRVAGTPDVKVDLSWKLYRETGGK
ncbi:MAG: hypothetical protein GY842_01150 [bacterium]|nr:hypothetical protein [bacterium]